ncbi:hypothetical protein HXX76_000856 [Chlamydomonas incerta]|uniref:Ubiquinone biosynthesis O-methyltransferase, mitochondrial n=1 Tax=Chlamydomonas incerta TaxID=51695 RepID=A0A835WF39_CHLIN|nr:hypothetical protein HXX76_000856 [Chlamydomonas incerta]|eukprot:KAG2446267.1 hypothetical protein HXX76_000856 [Chlamydomonas incerta]
MSAAFQHQGISGAPLRSWGHSFCPASLAPAAASAASTAASAAMKQLPAWRGFPSLVHRPEPHRHSATATRSFASTAAGGPSTSGSSSSGSARATGASVDAKEAAKFAALAAEWWRGDGPFAPLHALNPARVRFVRHSLAAAMGLDAGAPQPLAGLRVLDVGCGGGILSESLARLGAQVTGIDVTRENVEAARLHAAADPEVAARVRYEVISVEDLAAAAAATAAGGGGGDSGLYDAVLASEVLEHVARPHAFVGVLASLLAPRPGASVIISTLNRTPAAWAVAIAGAEYVTGIVPVGTHSWKKFITPEELALMGDAAGLQVWQAAGMAPLGPALSWTLTSDLAVNYIACMRRRAELQQPGAEPQERAEAEGTGQGQGQQPGQQQEAAAGPGGASGMAAPGMGLP